MWDLDTVNKMNKDCDTGPRFIQGECVSVNYGKRLAFTVTGSVLQLDNDDLPVVILTGSGPLALSPKERRTAKKR